MGLCGSRDRENSEYSTVRYQSNADHDHPVVLDKQIYIRNRNQLQMAETFPDVQRPAIPPTHYHISFEQLHIRLVNDNYELFVNELACPSQASCRNDLYDVYQATQIVRQYLLDTLSSRSMSVSSSRSSVYDIPKHDPPAQHLEIVVPNLEKNEDSIIEDSLSTFLRRDGNSDNFNRVPLPQPSPHHAHTLLPNYDGPASYQSILGEIDDIAIDYTRFAREQPASLDLDHVDDLDEVTIDYAQFAQSPPLQAEARRVQKVSIVGTERHDTSHHTTCQQHVSPQSPKIEPEQIVVSALNEFCSSVLGKHEYLNEIQKKEKCPIQQCEIFKRHYRSRDGENASDSNDDRAYLQHIQDKIHCYVFHTLDIGYRPNQLVADSDFENVRKCLTEKQELLHQLDERGSNTKFAQIAEIAETLEPQESVFEFGVQFKYGYKHEDIYFVGDEPKEWKEHNAITVKRKYSSLKEEMLENKVSRLALAQFTTEYKKARLYLQSVWKKQHYPSMSEEHMLSIMIYCNYTQLQTKFSATYYDAIEDHPEFYHLATNIKQSVHKFGVELRSNEAKSLYHGASKPLALPRLFHDGTGICGRGINIYAPLSTSSSFAVAMSFANNGAIFEFGDDDGWCQCKCLSLSWLSDFPNEDEYLFIQNMDAIKVINIIDCQYGHEYKILLRSLEVIDKLMSGSLSTESNSDEETLCSHRIIQRRLSPLEASDGDHIFTEYAQTLISAYCDKKRWIEIQWKNARRHNTLLELLCTSETSVFDLSKLLKVFPNVLSLRIDDIGLDGSILKCIECNLSDFEDMALKSIIIKTTSGSVADLVSKHADTLKSVGYVMRVDDNANNTLYITKSAGPQSTQENNELPQTFEAQTVIEDGGEYDFVVWAKQTLKQHDDGDGEWETYWNNFVKHQISENTLIDLAKFNREYQKQIWRELIPKIGLRVHFQHAWQKQLLKRVKI